MRRTVAAMLLLLLSVSIPAAALAADIPVLAYHDIVPEKNGDPYAITVKDFQRQMAYLRGAGYQPISLRWLEDARVGRAQLPPKPVLLTFDDGYKSYHRYAYPLLAQYGFPSAVSIVTAWIDRRSIPDYTTAEFMSWNDLREVARSPLVEVLSHTDDLHHSARANAQGARFPAAVTRVYDASHGTYESDEAHRARVRADLARSVERIQAELGIRPAGITWPYGKYDAALVEEAAALGMPYHLTLDAEPTRLAGLPRVNRETFRDYRTLADLGDALTFRYFRKNQLRFVEVDIGAIAEQPSDRQAALTARLARRVEVLRVGAVLLRPFSKDASRAYFHNNRLPVVADVLNQIAYQLANAAGLEDLYLSVPAAVDPEVLADLARLNWFTGVVLEGTSGSEVFERASAVVRRYKPAAKIGVRGRAEFVGKRPDFVLSDIGADSPAFARDLEEAVQGEVPSLVRLGRTVGTSFESLRRAMALLRASGVAHYGYGLDDYLENRPAPLRIVRPLTEHTVVDNGD